MMLDLQLIHSPDQRNSRNSDLHCGSPLNRTLQLIQEELSEIGILKEATNDFIKDAHPFHFLGNDCVCVRCGAK